MTRKQYFDFGSYPATEAQRIADAINRKFSAGVVTKPINGHDYMTVATERECVMSLDRFGRIKSFCEGIFWADCH